MAAAAPVHTAMGPAQYENDFNQGGKERDLGTGDPDLFQEAKKHPLGTASESPNKKNIRNAR